jgi:mono/diheme cytochrome c family protein
VSSNHGNPRRLAHLFRRSWVSVALIISFTSGCDFPGRPRAGDRSVAALTEQSFGVLYGRNCAGCHGLQGELGPAPPLNDKLFRSLISDEDLLRIISHGRAGTLMPAFAEASGGQLTAEQVLVLAQGIKSYWGPAEPVPAGTPPIRLEAGEPDRGPSHDAGLQVFARACASCHGDQGEGGDFAGAINVSEFVALSSDQALRRLIITGRPDLGMPNSSDGEGRRPGYQPLTSREVTELVSLLASWRDRGGPTVSETGR